MGHGYRGFRGRYTIHTCIISISYSYQSSTQASPAFTESLRRDETEIEKSRAPAVLLELLGLGVVEIKQLLHIPSSLWFTYSSFFFLCCQHSTSIINPHPHIMDKTHHWPEIIVVTSRLVVLLVH